MRSSEGHQDQAECRTQLGSGLDPKLLEILACPACKQPVKLDGERLVCVQCGRRYPIREGIPDMLIDQAEPAEAPRQPGSTH